MSIESYIKKNQTISSIPTQNEPEKILFWFLALKINPLKVKVTLYVETSQ